MVATTQTASWPQARWAVPLFGLAALLLVPWVVLLVYLLPSAHKSAHWDIAWSGFDVLLALLLSAVAVAAWRGSLWFEGVATAAATLLFVDAWFDILTSSSRAELFFAIGEAVFVELPLAALCLILARDAERRMRLRQAAGLSSPARIATSSRFAGGASGQAQRGSYAHDGL